MWNKKPRKNEKINTLIGESSRLKGDIQFVGGLHVDGHIEGNVIADSEDPGASISISDKGVVNGQIHCPFISLNGVVHGNVHSTEHIEIAAKAHVEGDVRYQLLEMAVGAQVNGKLLRIDASELNPHVDTDEPTA